MALLQVNIKSAGYPGKKRAIRDIEFELEKGKLVGLIGPNGAGKSTTLKAILGLLPEIEGDITLDGSGKKIAYIPEQPVLYEGFTLWEHLELGAAAYGLSKGEFLAKSGELLKLFRLEEVKHHLPQSFSKGMQQKVMLILGFLMEPDVFVVDEPFYGLDPKAIKDFLGLLDKARERGAGVLMSTHVLDTAEKICDSFVLIADGQILSRGNLDKIRSQCGLPGGSLFDCFDHILEREL